MLTRRTYRAYALALGILWSWVVAGVIMTGLVWPGAVTASGHGSAPRDIGVNMPHLSEGTNR